MSRCRTFAPAFRRYVEVLVKKTIRSTTPTVGLHYIVRGLPVIMVIRHSNRPAKNMNSICKSPRLGLYGQRGHGRPLGERAIKSNPHY